MHVSKKKENSSYYSKMSFDLHLYTQLCYLSKIKDLNQAYILYKVSLFQILYLNTQYITAKIATFCIYN